MSLLIGTCKLLAKTAMVGKEGNRSPSSSFPTYFAEPAGDTHAFSYIGARGEG